jgi:hypothetical protein
MHTQIMKQVMNEWNSLTEDEQIILTPEWIKTRYLELIEDNESPDEETDGKNLSWIL